MKTGIYLSFLFGIIIQGFAQTAIDSILKKAYTEVYENPESAIKTAINVLNEKNITEEDKIEALLLISTGYSSERNYAKSLEYAVKAAQLLPKINSDAFKINVYSRLGIQYQQLKIYNKAHSYLDNAITVANSTKQKFDVHKLLAFNNAIRGMVYKEQMSCDIAQNYFNKSLYHYSKCDPASVSYANISVIVYNKGNCFLSLNEVDSARISFKNSYKYADRINANSLKAFANKGLAEVETSEGKYDTAIGLLLEASKMSDSVGDQVLNQGIYKGLSENYLLTNELEKHKLYHRKFEETSQRIKKNNTETLNQFVLQIDAESEKEIEGVKSDWLYYQILLATVVILLLVLLLFEVFKAQKRYRILKMQREKLENTPSSKRLI